MCRVGPTNPPVLHATSACASDSHWIISDGVVNRNRKKWNVLACIASVSVGLGSKERPRNGTGTVFCPREMGAKAKIRKRGWGRGRKELADTSLVSPSHTDVRGASDNSPSSQTPPPTPRETRETTSTSQNPYAASMPLVREQLQKLRLSSDTIDILMNSWRKFTGKQMYYLPRSMGDLL